MQITALEIPGAFLVSPRVFRDARGGFVKSFVGTAFSALGLRTDFIEQYHSTSIPGVIRGMHFQLPPHQHAKLVYCAIGEVTDVFLDLRRGSPTYGRFGSVPLSAENGHAIYLPPGLAHGFLATREPALMVYNVTSEYQPSHDAGIRWDSFGFPWGVSEPVVSDRDAGFVGLDGFQSPFEFGA